MLFDSPKFLSLVLNISLRAKIANLVKNELIDFVNWFDEEDQFYLSSDHSHYYNHDDIVEAGGKRVAQIGNWRPQETAPCLNIELDKALQAVTAHGDIDGDWYICLITDRYKKNDEVHLAQIMSKNIDIWYEAKIMVITLGDHYDFKEYEELCAINKHKHTHLQTPIGIKSILTEWIKEK